MYNLANVIVHVKQALLRFFGKISREIIRFPIFVEQFADIIRNNRRQAIMACRLNQFILILLDQ